MMHNIRYINRLVVLGIIVSGIFFSCGDDFFDSKPGGRITPDQHYKSLDDVIHSYYGCYSLLQDIAENQVLVDGLRSDQMSTTENANFDMIAIENHDLSSSNQYFDPSDYYKIVVNVNEVLPNLDKVLEIDRDFDSLAYRTYQGSLITLRSWAYFNLARINGEVAFVNESDPTQPPEYLDKLDAITKLIKELKQLYDEEDLIRFDIDHYVLLGEMLLEKGNFFEAVTYLKYAVDGPYFPARDNYYMVTASYGFENWRTIFINSASSDNSSTVRTAIPYSFEQQTRNMLEEWFSNAYMVKPSTSIINAFENEVLRTGEPGDLYRGPGASYDSLRNEFDELEYYIAKYSLVKDVPHGADVILYRDSDMHLLLAEALNRNGQSDLALTLLNTGFGSMTNRPSAYNTWSKNKGVRGRVNLADVTAESVEAIEDLIIEERAKELAFEGKRWFDLVRIAERRGDPAYLADRVASKFEDPAKAEEIRSKLMSSENWYIPIPR